MHALLDDFCSTSATRSALPIVKLQICFPAATSYSSLAPKSSLSFRFLWSKLSFSDITSSMGRSKRKVFSTIYNESLLVAIIKRLSQINDQNLSNNVFVESLFIRFCKKEANFGCNLFEQDQCFSNSPFTVPCPWFLQMNNSNNVLRYPFSSPSALSSKLKDHFSSVSVTDTVCDHSACACASCTPRMVTTSVVETIVEDLLVRVALSACTLILFCLELFLSFWLVVVDEPIVDWYSLHV